MPQSSLALQSRVRCYFPKSINLENDVLQYLINLGCKLNKGMITVPKDVYIDDGEARDCIDWLVTEWDYAWTKLK